MTDFTKTITTAVYVRYYLVMSFTKRSILYDFEATVQQSPKN